MKLRTYRVLAHLTQQELAERLGLSELSIIKYEGGTTIPSKEALLRIYALTAGAVTPNDFFDLEALVKSPVSNSLEHILVAAGLMSGTSMDGIDAVLMITDGQQFIKDLGKYSVKYDAEFKVLLRACEQAVWGSKGDLNLARNEYKNALRRYLCQSQAKLETAIDKTLAELCFYFYKEKDKKEITFDQVIQRSSDLHAEAMHRLLQETGYKARNIDIVGYHGQTLFHSPSQRITLQAGNAQSLADQTGIAVVYDFRANDVRNGGQGAPFAPLYHKALAQQIGLAPVVIANCGGISNITIIGSTDEELCAFDCGPGNALIDRFVQFKIDKLMDQDGIYGSQGTVDNNVLQALKAKAIVTKDGSNYLEKIGPKSLDVNELTLIPEVEALSLQDGCATLEAYTADCIVNSLGTISGTIPKLWVLAGGGWNNKVITRELEQRLKDRLGPDVRIQHANQVGWSGQAIEAQIFAYLSVRCLRKLPLSLPGTTGVPKPLTGGMIAFPHDDIKKASRNTRSLIEAHSSCP